MIVDRSYCMRKSLHAFLKISKAKGFTLIELLVVLGILGILAVAILAAINPIEQLNKAQDTSLKNVATTFVDATVQYYSVHNTVPWDTTANGGTGCHAGPAISNVNLKSGLSSCITQLITENELKASFNSSPNLNKIIITTRAPAGGTYTTFACFKPVSQAVKADSNTHYTATGGSCTGTNCYWCAQ